MASTWSCHICDFENGSIAQCCIVCHSIRPSNDESKLDFSKEDKRMDVNQSLPSNPKKAPPHCDNNCKSVQNIISTLFTFLYIIKKHTKHGLTTISKSRA